MQTLFQHDPWRIIENDFRPSRHEQAESIFSIGNGRMGQRANFEEDYTGDSLQGTYVAGVYYPDKTRVGWWKNGYPEYFAKVINSPSFINISVELDGEKLDLAKWRTEEFQRILDMKQGILYRNFTAESPNGKKIIIHAERFFSMANTEIAAIRYAITVPEEQGSVKITSSINGDVRNEDSNYDEKFWINKNGSNSARENSLLAETKKLGFHVAYSMKNDLSFSGDTPELKIKHISANDMIANEYLFHLQKGETVTLTKIVSVVSSLNHSKEQLETVAKNALTSAALKGYDTLKTDHIQWWEQKWENSDIVIEGDIAAQQGIRFNIFHLNQTYTGEDERLNIGPKGFTGEKYGGVTYWDTEAYCVPFFLGTAPQNVTHNLLKYRYKQLDKAIENGVKLGFNKGAALYPMVTMNGEECHNEWEITFEEIHRNGAIAYAIYNYVNYTGDNSYWAAYGLEVLIAISRFWAQRVNWSAKASKYMILGVTGPNEYENNINNNWYTNYLAKWCIDYTTEVMNFVRNNNPNRFNEIMEYTCFNEVEEGDKWQHISQNMYFPEDAELGVFLQQDGYMDKEQILADDLPANQRPINQHWSWDRILRSCFIKQADVLQGMFFFEDHFTPQQLEKNFDFYEPRTVHESSLSPCVHSILACKINRIDKAYSLYLRTSRIDLDDYNREVAEGLHITSMAGTWMSVVQGFGGLRVKDGQLHLQPVIPKEWSGYTFKVNFRSSLVCIKVSKSGIDLSLEKGSSLQVVLNGNMVNL